MVQGIALGEAQLAGQLYIAAGRWTQWYIYQKFVDLPIDVHIDACIAMHVHVHHITSSCDILHLVSE